VKTWLRQESFGKFLPQLGFVKEKPGRYYHTFIPQAAIAVGILRLTGQKS
jgi:hypothetical protein